MQNKDVKAVPSEAISWAEAWKDALACIHEGRL